jgi:hypothetical protein
LTLGLAPKRAKPRWFGVLAVVTGITLISTGIALAGPVGTASGFEDDDANLVVNTTFDWNGFDPTTWTGTAPQRQSTKTASGWLFLGLEDWQATTADSAFAGGTKQDDNCASVITGKAPNKDDLKRAYVSSKTVNGHVFLNLAWIRIPQNTTSPSAHIGFEFNKGTTPCPAGSDGLVNRVAGDMLIVYDFEGGTTDVPTLTLRRWVTSGACEVATDSPPCWGTATNLTAGGFAEGKVNTATTVLDQIAPTDETLGLNTFGEAGIDLTAAGVFGASTCEGFGKVFAVSRSSGNSAQAQMKDLVGPGNFNLNNCGTVTIIKHTIPAGVDQNFDFTSTLAGAQIDCTADATPASFTLNDAGTDTETCTKVPIGSYTVLEGANPAGFVFDSLSCTATGSGSGSQDGTVPKQANITIAAGGDTVTCTYVNKQELGAIKITKTDSKTGDPLSGASFSIKSGGTAITGSPFSTGADGTICVDNLAFGTYAVKEESAPAGYVIDDSASHNVTVDNNAKCSDDPYVGESISFTDTPVSDIQVRFRDGGSGVTSADISCDNTTGTTSTAGTTGWDDTTTITGIHAPTTVICTIVIDP